MRKEKHLIKKVECRKNSVTIYGTPEYAQITGRSEVTYQKCGRRKAEALFIHDYFFCIENQMQKHDYDKAEAMYLAGEINWKCFITMSTPVKARY